MKKAVALTLIAALVLAGIATALSVVFSLGGSDDDEPERDADAGGARSAAVVEPPSDDLEPYYSQEVDWQACGDGYACAWLKVPQDYADPDGEQLDLALLKVLARNQEKKVGSLVVNPGGPGAPGTQFAAQAGFVFSDRMLDYVDVVGFDPRGTGRSNPLDCVDDERLDVVLAADPTPDDAAEVAEVSALQRELAEGCRKRSGDLVEHVSTVEVARDMDVLRAALGHEKLDYYGASYGTMIGATYAELFPERVGHLVLDGAIDPEADVVESNLVQAKGFETALRAYVTDCVEGGDCLLGATVDEGLGKLTGLLDQIDAKPLKAGKRTLEVGNAFYGLVFPLYDQSYWSMLDEALGQAFDGDGSGLLSLSDIYHSRTAGGYSDNSSEAISVVNCLDDPGSVPVEEIPAQFPAFEKASPTFGKVFAWSLAACEPFNFPEPAPLEIRGEGAAPIVVTGTTRDPATPMEWAEAMADQLESAVLVRRDGDGHTAFNVGNACVDDALEGYLLDGKVPDDNLSC